MNDIETMIILPNKELKVNVKIQLVENPTPEVLMKSQVSLINKLIFDAI